MAEYVRLRGSASGQRYRLPGAGCAEDDWAIPMGSFRMEELLGQLAHVMEAPAHPCAAPATPVLKRRDGRSVWMKGYISCFVSPTGELR